MDSFTCLGCGKVYPAASGEKLSWPAQIAFFLTTLGGFAPGRLCHDCRSGITAFGVIGAMILAVIAMALIAKWYGS